MGVLTEEWLQIIDAEAAERARMHANQASTRPLSPDFELVGLVGEAQFASEFGLPVNWERKPGGDSGFDFIVPLRFTVDVKTFRKPGHLIQEQGKVSADIYVLAGYFDETRSARLLGWEMGVVLRRAPLRDFGYGIITHHIPRENLRSMDELQQRTMRLK